MKEGGLGYWAGLVQYCDSSKAVSGRFCSKLYLEHGLFAWGQ